MDFWFIINQIHGSMNYLSLCFLKWILVCFPIGFYLIFFAWMNFKFYREKINLRAFCIDKRAENERLSASRLVLVMTGITLSIIAIGCTSFAIYNAINSCGEIPDYSKLTALVTALGIGGVLPYFTNQFLKK